MRTQKIENKAISLDAETGFLNIDNKKFALSEKHYTVQKILLTY